MEYLVNVLEACGPISRENSIVNDQTRVLAAPSRTEIVVVEID